MNRIYSLVWNRALRSVQVASELARAKTGGVVSAATPAGSPARNALALAVLIALAGLAPVSVAHAAGQTLSRAMAGGVAPDRIIVCGDPGPAGGVHMMPCGGGGGGPTPPSSPPPPPPPPGYGAGGAGGNGGGSYDSATKSWSGHAGAAGTAGGNGTNGTGGAGGTAGATAGAAGVAGSTGTGYSGGGGGGGGAAGADWTSVPATPASSYTGGAGGAGGGVANANAGVGGGGQGGTGLLVGSGASATLTGITLTGGAGGYSPGGQGGAGGYGLVLVGSQLTLSGASSVVGGAGGSGAAGTGGYGADGAVLAPSGTTGSTLTIGNGVSVTGGNGGSGTKAAGSGGAGVVAIGNSSLIVAGSIAGGVSGATTPVQADAVYLYNGGNTLTLESGYAFTGNVASNGGDTLALGGTGTSDTFDMHDVVAALPATPAAGTTYYVGFDALEKSGTGTWTLTGNTSVAAPWTLQQGTLAIGSSGALGTGAVDMTAGTTLSFAADGLSLANAFTLNGDPTYNVATGQADAITGVIADGTTPGTLELTGGGTLQLTAANTYTGETVVNAGTLALTGTGTGSIADSSDVNVASGATFDILGTNSGASIQSLDGAGSVSLGTLTLTDAGNTNDTGGGVFSGAIGGSGGLVVSGGTETLSGSNTFTGATTINNGATIIGEPSLGARFTGLQDTSALNLDGGTLQLQAANWTTGAGVTLGNGGGAFSILGTTGGQSRTLELDGIVSGNGGLTFTADGSDSLVLTNGNNLFSGGTTISRAATFAPGSEPAVVVEATGALGTGDVTLDTGTQLEFLGTSAAQTSAGSRTLDLSGAATTLSFQAYSTAGSATINAAANAAAITNFAANSDAGSATINNGALGDLSFYGGSSAANAAITNHGASAQTDFYAGSTADNATITNSNGGLTVFAGNGAGAGNEVSAGSATITNAGSATTPTGSQAVNPYFYQGGVVELEGGVDASGATIVNNAGGLVAVFSANGVPPSIGSLSGDGNVLMGAEYNSSGQQVPFDVSLGALNQNDTIGGVIADDLYQPGTSAGDGITKVGTGTLTLDGINTYTGLTEVQDGSLIIGDASTPTASIAGSAQVDSGATLGGFGTVGAAGTTTEIQSGGVLSPGADGAIGTLAFGGNLTLDAGSVLDYALGAPAAGNPSTAPGLSSHVSVDGALTFNGATTLNLTNPLNMGPGLYNLASYGTLVTTGCAFTGNTACITLGTVPVGSTASDFTITNNTAGSQIDLYDSAAEVSLNIWAPTSATAPGGSGTWSADSNTWTDPQGDYGPAAMTPQPGFAIFQGTFGTVTVDDSAGNVSVTGMQFAVNGYSLTGGAVQLLADANGDTPIIEVGDGSSASAGMTATIDSPLDGSAGFAKTGAGTLVLGMGPGLTGGVSVQGGTLQLGEGATAGAGLIGNSVTMAAGTTLVLDNGGVLSNQGAAAVTGSNFTITTTTGGAGSGEYDAIIGAVPFGPDGLSGPAAAIDGTGFTATFNGATVIAGGAGLAASASTTVGNGADAITGSGFTVVNNNTRGGNPFLGTYGIDGGAGGYSYTGLAGAAGAGGAGISGSGFTVTNSGDVLGGAGGGTLSGTAGMGGAGITGTGFTLTNTGAITGGAGANRGQGLGGVGGAGVASTGGSTITNSGAITGGASGKIFNATAPAGGAGIVAAAGDSITNTGTITGGTGGYTYASSTPAIGGVGIDATGRVNIVTSGSIAGGACGGNGCSGISGMGQDYDLAPADAVVLSNGGNTLTLESGFSFAGNVVSTSGTGAAAADGGDTLALGGSTNDTFDAANIVDAPPANATTTQYVGFNAFAKTGSSTWTLTDTTSSVTPWTLDDGTLSVSADANLGASAGALTFNGGTLENTAAFATARDVTLESAGAFQTDADLTVSGVVAGSGAIAKTGTAMLTLTGANTFSGGTSIDAGEVDVGNSASLGTGKVAMAAGTTLGFAASGLNLANAFTLSGDPAFDVASASQSDTVSGVIADGSTAGTLEKTGAGTLILTGANTYTGGTTISAGTLQVGNGGTTGAIGTGAITDNGTLVYDLSNAVLLPAGLTGTGALIQQGSGTFTVNGDDSGFAGTTTIKTGIATVGDDSHASASLGGMVNVAQGATLTGIGTVGGLDLSGTLSPGGSIGTFHVTGDATFEAGSTFNVEANPDGTADQLAAGGSVVIKGGNTLVIAQPGNWAPQTTYTIITSGKGVSGRFAGVSDNQAFLTPSLGYSADDVTLILARNNVSFGSVAQTPNQLGAADGIEGAGFGQALYDAVVKLDAADARYAFDQASGEYYASQQTARVNDSRYVREAMNQRLRNGDADAEAAKLGASNVTAWAHAWGHWGTTDSDGNAGRLADNGDGLLIGADMPVGTQGRIGITGGASRDSLSIGSRNSWGRETSTWLGAFGGVNVNAFSLRGGIAYAWDQIPSNRIVAFPGYSDRLSGNATGDTLTGFIEGAWTFHFNQGSVSPFLNLAHTRVETNASTEAGGAAALTATEGTADVSFSTLGARGEIQLAHHLNLHGELGWQHAYGDTTPDRTLNFVAGGPAFTEYGVPVAKNAGLGRIGIGWHHGNVAVNADYEGLAGGGAKDQAAKLSVSVTF